jgi:hypothetical protein
MVDTLKITFELELLDNPPLYKDLVQFPKGPRRVNRLRTLAHAGLIAQTVPPTALPSVRTEHAPSQDSSMMEASLELFGPASEE